MDDPEKLVFRALTAEQPIGTFYNCVIPFEDLLKISYRDMREIESDLDAYVGIQRRLSQKRVSEIGEFTNTIDAVFPTSIVLSVPASCADFDEGKSELTVHQGPDPKNEEVILPIDSIAKILDGQHRIEGLKAFRGVAFDVPVSVFVEADIADEAFIFATVNLAQTKVNKSLVYDLLDYARSRSPQKSCHDIAVALDRHKNSPLHKMIKRLGHATPGRSGETLTQATVVNALLPLITKDAQGDRESLARGKTITWKPGNYLNVPFRAVWVEKKDSDIAKNIMNFFHAIEELWPEAWRTREKGQILPRTNGFRACMRTFKEIYISERKDAYASLSEPVVSQEVFERWLSNAKALDISFDTSTFPPGTSGEKRLYDQFMAALFQRDFQI